MIYLPPESIEILMLSEGFFIGGKNKMEKQQKKQRSSNIELLRILAMAMIIVHHSVVHGGLNTLGDNNFNNLLILFMGTCGKLGVDMFVIITGFFDVGKKFNFKKLVSVEGPCWFYGIVCLIGALIYGTTTLSQIKISDFAFPIWNNLYWFMTCFFILYCLSPYINRLVQNISQKELGILILILFVTNFVSSIRFMRLVPAFGKLGQNRVVWFCMLYLIGAYIKLYPNKFTKRLKPELWTLVSVFALYIIKIAVGGFSKTTITYVLFSDFSLIFAILLFLIFKNIKMKNIKCINVIASCMIGVYLFHDNPFIRHIIWEDILNLHGYRNAYSLILREGFLCVCILAIGIILDLIRQKFFSPICNSFGRNCIMPVVKKTNAVIIRKLKKNPDRRKDNV